MGENAYFHRFIMTLVLMLAGIPFIIWGIVQGADSMQNAPILWIPADNEERVQYEQFRDRFHVRDAIIVSWKGCTVDDERLKLLTDALQADQAAPSGVAQRKLVDRVLTGYAALRDLMAEPLAIPRSEAIERLKGILVGPDGQTSCAIVVLTEQGARAGKEESVDTVITALEEVVGLDADDYHLAGSPIEGIAIDQASTRSLNYYLIPSGLLVLLLGWLCLKSWRFTIAVISVATFGELLVLSLVHYWGASLNAVLIVMAPLIFVLTVSAGVHLVNYYHDAVRAGGPQGAAHRALVAAWLPCGLAALTTAIGMGSLVVSEMVPVQQFGAISAVGVLVTTALLFSLLPGLMQRWPKVVFPSLADDESVTLARHTAFEYLAAFIVRFRTPIVVLALGLMIAGAVGLSRVRTSVNVLSLLVPDSRISQDYRWLEQHVGPMVPIEIVIHLDRDAPLDLLQKIELLRAVERQIEQIDVIGGTMSAATFVPEVPRERGFRATIQRSMVRSRLEAQREGLVEGRYLYETEDQEQWRITTRAPALIDVDYSELMQKLESQVQPVLEHYEQQGVDSIGAFFTGIMPLVDVAQRKLLEDLIRSFLTALLLVAIVMMLVLRSIVAGLIAMLPNLFPTLVLFGGMGWLDRPIDIGSMMTASVALGIAIDGTLHYLTWFRHEVSQGCKPEEAIGMAYRHCGTAMWQTTVICGLGLLVFALSDFVPTRQFAWMMLFLLLAALLGDLVQLPALLVGPFRRFLK